MKAHGGNLLFLAMLRVIHSEETDIKIIYVWRCFCKETDQLWHQIHLLNKDLSPICAQVIFNDEGFTALTDSMAIHLAKKMLYESD